MDALVSRHVPVRVLAHIGKLNDCFGQFLVRRICDSGACREIQPQARWRALLGATLSGRFAAMRDARACFASDTTHMTTDSKGVPPPTDVSQAPKPSGAVFLSYASEDAAAAERIATTLRAAGIEVWFDKSELRGGDLWDRKINEQIHRCRLFMPIVSATTEARVEGYFRREWKLAVDRTHDLSERVAFLVPVVIDSTPELMADVPDAFRRVQWTRLPAGETPLAFVDRVRRLLLPAAAAEPAGARPTTGAVSVATPSNARPRPLRLGAIAAVVAGVLLVGGYALWRALSATGVGNVRTAAPAEIGLPAHTVAVLPFENISADPNDGFLATGIAESVLHRLASVKRLSVIARTSSFTFRGHNVDARDIGRRLNARYLVEGSVQRAGERLRVTAQLLDASSGSDVWSLRFERRMGDIFELEDEISGKVTDALAVSLQESAGNSTPRRTPNLDAYLSYLEGRSLLSTFKIADAQVGIERLRLIHANDSKVGLNSFVDRHENIGRGQLGEQAFVQMLAHPALSGLPWVLEVPGYDDKGPDRQNLEDLKRLAGRG